MSHPEDPGVLSSSPLTSPADEYSDNPLSPPLDAQEPQNLPGLDGTPVRCELLLSFGAVVSMSYTPLHGQGLM